MSHSYFGSFLRAFVQVCSCLNHYLWNCLNLWNSSAKGGKKKKAQNFTNYYSYTNEVNLYCNFLLVILSRLEIVPFMLLLILLVIAFTHLHWCQSKLYSLRNYKTVFVMQI